MHEAERFQSVLLENLMTKLRPAALEIRLRRCRVRHESSSYFSLQMFGGVGPLLKLYVRFYTPPVRQHLPVHYPVRNKSLSEEDLFFVFSALLILAESIEDIHGLKSFVLSAALGSRGWGFCRER